MDARSPPYLADSDDVGQGPLAEIAARNGNSRAIAR
jgi:hypothetical protein